MTRKSAAILVSIAFLVILGAIGETWHESKQSLNVLLLTVESLRADAVTQETTPNLLRLAAAHGIRFSEHRAVSAWTGTNIVTLLTGWTPFQHRVHSRGQRISAEHNLALETIADAGWRVSGLQAFMRVPIFDQLGLAREGIGAAENLPADWLAARRRRRILRALVPLSAHPFALSPVSRLRARMASHAASGRGKR